MAERHRARQVEQTGFPTNREVSGLMFNTTMACIGITLFEILTNSDSDIGFTLALSNLFATGEILLINRIRGQQA